MKRFLAVLLLISIMLCNIGCVTKNIYDNENTPSDTTQTPEDLTSITGTPVPDSNEQDTIQSESLTGSANFRFVVLADSRGLDHGVNTDVVEKILGEIKQLSPQPEFAIMPGDLTDGSKTYSGIKSQLAYFKDIITQYYPISFFYPGIGNHEMRAGKNGEKAFAETFSEFKATFLKDYNRTSYYFDVGNTRLFMLNSDHTGEMHEITGKQLDWLKSSIDKNKRTFFFFHEPAYPTGAEAGNSLDKHPAARDIFWKVADTSSGAIVFCGHEHNYSRRLIDSSFNEKVGGKSFQFKNKVFQVISGGFGAPLYKQYTSKKNMIIPPVPQYHYTIVDITDGAVNIQAVDIDGNIIDTFQIK